VTAAAHPILLGAGHGAAQAMFPLIAAAVALLFGIRLMARFLRRRKPYEGVWGVALLMFAAASVAMFVGVVGGWGPFDFRVYWLFGAILNVPYLFAGEVYLLARRRSVGHAVLLVVMAVSVYAGIEVWSSSLTTAALAVTLPLGKDVFGTSSVAYRLAQILAFPAYFLLLGGLVWSAWQTRNRKELRHVTAGTVMIALGATIVAIGSGVGAGLHVVWLFSLSLAAGIVFMYAGFLRAGRQGRHPQTL
jgi:hypothetical protein